MNLPDTLQTATLCLREPRLSDAETIFDSYAQDPDVVRFLSWTPHESLLQTRQFLKHCLDETTLKSSKAWVIENKSSSELLGMIDLRWDEFSASFGYVIAKHHWGKGVTTQALSAIRDTAMHQPRLYRFWGICDVDNIASARVMEKAGLELEGRLNRYCVHPNVDTTPRDCYSYAKTR